MEEQEAKKTPKNKTKQINPTGLDAEGTGQVSLFAVASKLPSMRTASAGEGVSSRRPSYRHLLPWKQVSAHQNARDEIHYQPFREGQGRYPCSENE